MANSKPRSRVLRVADQVQQILSECLTKEFHDSRFRLMSITWVTLSNDLAHARVFVSTLCNEEQAHEYIDLLEQHKGRLRSYLAQHSRLRKAPALQFIHDDSSLQSERISNLLDQALGSSDDKSSES